MPAVSGYRRDRPSIRLDEASEQHMPLQQRVGDAQGAAKQGRQHVFEREASGPVLSRALRPGATPAGSAGSLHTARRGCCSPPLPGVVCCPLPCGVRMGSGAPGSRCGAVAWPPGRGQASPRPSPATGRALADVVTGCLLARRAIRSRQRLLAGRGSPASAQSCGRRSTAPRCSGC